MGLATSSRRPWVAAALAAVVVSCGHPGGGSEADRRLRPVAVPDAPSPPAKVVLVGLDGLDWGLLDPCIADGGCPTFARLKADGAWAHLRSHPPVLSPLIWTSIATGRTPEVHGVLDFVVRDPDTGRDVPISNRFRQVPAFWNVLTQEGRRVHVVNWWATHPAEEIGGVMVTERPFYQLFGVAAREPEPTDVSPPGLRDEVARRRVAVEEIGFERVAGLTALDRETYDARVSAAGRLPNPFEERVQHLRKIVATTEGVFAVSRWLAAERPFDLLALYVEGTDTIGHRFAHYLPPRLPWVDAAEQALFSQTMRRYYELVDAELGRLIAAAPDEVTWIVAADHGFHTGAARPAVPPDDFTTGAAEWHRMTGVLLASGPHVRPGRMPGADIYDLCRTLLWLQGAPVSDELEGRELVEMMRPEWADAHPPLRVRSYDDRPRPWLDVPVEAAPVDDSRLAELEALGYVVRAEPGAAPEGGGDEKVTAAFNRAKLAHRRGDLEAAVGHYLEAVERDERFFYAMLELYGVFRSAGEHERALYWLARAMQTYDPALPDRVPVAFVREAIAAGRLDGARTVLDAMPGSWTRRPSYHAAVGIAELERGRDRAARAAFERSLALDPADMDAVDGMMQLARKGAPVDWKARLDAAYRAVETDLDGLRQLARVCSRYGQHAAAERCLRRLLESDPTDTESLVALADALAAQDRPGEAADAVDWLLELEPDAAEAWRRLAELEREAGDPEAAAAAEARAAGVTE